MCIVSFRCYVFCLLVVRVKLSVLANPGARKTSLKKPNRGEGIVSRKLRQKNAYDFLGLSYCFLVLLCICVVSCPYVIYFPTFVAQYSLFVVKVPLNPKQTNKQTFPFTWNNWSSCQSVCTFTCETSFKSHSHPRESLVKYSHCTLGMSY